jgi:hypothetical protein
MSMARTLMRVQTLKVDTFRQLQEHFMRKVQLEEQLQDNNDRLHFHRGVVEALSVVERYIAEEQQQVGDETPLMSAGTLPVPADGDKQFSAMKPIPKGLYPEYDAVDGAGALPRSFQGSKTDASMTATPHMDVELLGKGPLPGEKYGL